MLRAWIRSKEKSRAIEAARNLWLRDLARDPTPNRMRRFGQALVLAAELPGDVRRLHAHFLHTPASVTRYAALLLGCRGRARRTPRTSGPRRSGKSARSSRPASGWSPAPRPTMRTCRALAPPGRVELVYHGLDFSRFPLFEKSASRQRRQSRLVILSVGRLVEKKGTDVLLEALARLPADLSWRLVHVGGGPLKEKLARHARRLGIAERVQWRGARTQVELLADYRAADLFALASRVARDGDRDGLPNVLVEAQSQGLACVATRVSGIPELIDDGVTGLLVEPEAPQELAQRARSADPRSGAAPRVRRGRSTAGAGEIRPGRQHRPPGPALRPARARNRIRARNKPMRIAFYAPLKSPTHDTPSGDRRVARLLMDALARAGHRSSWRRRSAATTPAATRRARPSLRAQGAALGRALAGQWLAGPPAARPDLWFTYHAYYKAPDWLGPEACAMLDIPYVIAEASHAGQACRRPLGHRPSRRAGGDPARRPAALPDARRHAGAARGRRGAGARRLAAAVPRSCAVSRRRGSARGAARADRARAWPRSRRAVDRGGRDDARRRQARVLPHAGRRAGPAAGSALASAGGGRRQRARGGRMARWRRRFRAVPHTWARSSWPALPN